METNKIMKEIKETKQKMDYFDRKLHDFKSKNIHSLKYKLSEKNEELTEIFENRIKDVFGKKYNQKVLKAMHKKISFFSDRKVIKIPWPHCLNRKDIKRFDKLFDDWRFLSIDSIPFDEYDRKEFFKTDDSLHLPELIHCSKCDGSGLVKFPDNLFYLYVSLIHVKESE